MFGDIFKFFIIIIVLTNEFILILTHFSILKIKIYNLYL